MLPGVYKAQKKDGTIYYRASITYRSKHLSLGSFLSEEDASNAYREALRILNNNEITIFNYHEQQTFLRSDKVVMLLNFRDNGLYFNNPIYLRKGYFSYFLTENIELKFDNDDLFYYSGHRILRRQGHLYVNDYGMQYSILSRYGIKPYAVSGRDYTFANGDETDFRYSNIIVLNRYHGVCEVIQNGIKRYRVSIHINGNYKVGIYSSEIKAAIAYNKAADLAKACGIRKAFPENFIETVTPKEYANIYSKLSVSKKYLQYLQTISD